MITPTKLANYISGGPLFSVFSDSDDMYQFKCISRGSAELHETFNAGMMLLSYQRS